MLSPPQKRPITAYIKRLPFRLTIQEDESYLLLSWLCECDAASALLPSPFQFERVLEGDALGHGESPAAFVVHMTDDIAVALRRPLSRSPKVSHTWLTNCFRLRRCS